MTMKSLVLMPSLIQGSASIDTVQLVFLVV